MLRSYDEKYFKERNGKDSNIVDLASQLIEGTNSIDIILGLEDGELPCHGDVVYLLDEHGVIRSNTIKIFKYHSSSPDVKTVLESLYGAVSSAEQIKSLYSTSHRDLNTVASATIINFKDNYNRIINENLMKEQEKAEQDMDQLLDGVEGAEMWNWSGNKGEG